MQSLYDERVRREKRWGLVRAFVINACMAYYGIWLAIYLLAHFGVLAESAAFDSGPNLAALGLAALAGAAWCASRASLGRFLVERTNPFLKAALEPLEGNWWKMPSGIVTSAILLLTLVVGWLVLDIKLYNLFGPEGLGGAKRIFVEVFSPNPAVLDQVIEKMVETIFIAFLATLIALPFAFLLSFPTARNLMRGSRLGMFFYTVLRVVLNFTRSVEPIVWAIVFTVWVGIGPFAGMLALMLHSVASLAKLYSEQIENIDGGPLEAIEATGANKLQVIWYAVVPQIVRPYLSFTIYRWDINIRMATIIGLIGGGGVGSLLIQYQGLARWREVGTIVIVIAIVVWAMDYLSARIREALE